MPMIVYKTLDLKVLYVQARRILCEYCRQPFTYVLGERKTFNVTGIPIVSSDEGMQGEATKKAASSLAKIDKEKNKGVSLCPHCKRYQGFMVTHSQMMGLGCGFLGGLGIVGFAAMMASIWFMWSSTVVMGLTLGGSALGLAIGKKWALDRGPHRDLEDQRALKDDEVPDLLARCQQEGDEPFLHWHLAVGEEPAEDEAFLSLGIRDTSGRPPIFPREMVFDFVVGQLQQA